MKEIHIKATPEVIFPFLTDPQKIMQWNGIDAVVEPVAGGKYWVKVSNSHTVSGTYIAVEPPRRVVLAWGWEEGHDALAPGSTTVEITLTPDGDSTLLRLTHSGFSTEDARTNHGMGWDHYLERLAIRASGGDPGADSW